MLGRLFTTVMEQIVLTSLDLFINRVSKSLSRGWGSRCLHHGIFIASKNSLIILFLWLMMYLWGWNFSIPLNPKMEQTRLTSLDLDHNAISARIEPYVHNVSIMGFVLQQKLHDNFVFLLDVSLAHRTKLVSYPIKKFQRHLFCSNLV